MVGTGYRVRVTVRNEDTYLEEQFIGFLEVEPELRKPLIFIPGGTDLRRITQPAVCILSTRKSSVHYVTTADPTYSYKIELLDKQE